VKQYCIYILASQKNRTLYIGVTSNLIKRIQEHQQKIADGFTKRYKVDKLVYYEQTEDVISALVREKQMKKWNRSWKIRLIEKKNPKWRDLYLDLIQ
jgi:putative endonuclease